MAEPDPLEEAAKRYQQKTSPQDSGSVTPAPPQTIGHAAHEAWDAINPIPGIASMIRHPIDTPYNMGAAQVDEFSKARDLLQQRRYMEAAGHGLAGALPILGPMAARAGEQIGGTDPQMDKFGNVTKPGEAPDIAGGIGRSVGVLGAAEAPRIVPPAAKAIGQGVADASRGIAETPFSFRDHIVPTMTGGAIGRLAGDEGAAAGAAAGALVPFAKGAYQGIKAGIQNRALGAQADQMGPMPFMKPPEPSGPALGNAPAPEVPPDISSFWPRRVNQPEAPAPIGQRPPPEASQPTAPPKPKIGEPGYQWKVRRR